MHPPGPPEHKVELVSCNFHGILLFSALSGHGGLASSRRWTDVLVGWMLWMGRADVGPTLDGCLCSDSRVSAQIRTVPHMYERIY